MLFLSNELRSIAVITDSEGIPVQVEPEGISVEDLVTTLNYLTIPKFFVG